ncbi:MAG: bis(5'-nucleosyl)-tetraphosphatase, partial [Candidatus Gracilibacteria bacterium]
PIMNFNHPPKKPSHVKGGSSSKRSRVPRRDVHEKSCGIIIYRTDTAKKEFLLLHYPGGHWDFPKGHVEKIDADEHSTALRELAEETGITEVAFNDGYHEPMYYEFNRGIKERVKKVVVYFLAETKQIEVTISFEHKNFKWLPYEEALKRLTYENARDLLRKANKHLNEQQGPLKKPMKAGMKSRKQRWIRLKDRGWF